MKKLIVYWTLMEMGEKELPTHQYKRTRMRTEFPLDLEPEVAIAVIEDRNGRRAGDGRKTVGWSHKFAEIQGWTNAEVFDRDPETTDTFVQQILL